MGDNRLVRTLKGAPFALAAQWQDCVLEGEAEEDEEGGVEWLMLLRLQETVPR